MAELDEVVDVETDADAEGEGEMEPDAVDDAVAEEVAEAVVATKIWERAFTSSPLSARVNIRMSSSVPIKGSLPQSPPMLSCPLEPVR